MGADPDDFTYSGKSRPMASPPQPKPAADNESEICEQCGNLLDKCVCKCPYCGKIECECQLNDASTGGDDFTSDGLSAVDR